MPLNGSHSHADGLTPRTPTHLPARLLPVLFVLLDGWVREPRTPGERPRSVTPTGVQMKLYNRPPPCLKNPPFVRKNLSPVVCIGEVCGWGNLGLACLVCWRGAGWRARWFAGRALAAACAGCRFRLGWWRGGVSQLAPPAAGCRSAGAGACLLAVVAWRLACPLLVFYRRR
jgi:hypothetical protein